MSDEQIHEYDPDSEAMLEFYMHVGRLVHTCTGLEHAMQQLHETLLRTPWWQVTNAEGFEQARQGCVHVARFTGNASIQARVRELTSEAKAVWDLRGQLVHGHSSPAELAGGTPGAVSVTRERRSGDTSQEWTNAEIDELNSRAHQAWHDVEQYYLDLIDDTVPWLGDIPEL